MRSKKFTFVMGMLLASAVTVAGSPTDTPDKVKVDKVLQTVAIPNSRLDSAVRPEINEGASVKEVKTLPSLSRVPDVVGLIAIEAAGAVRLAGLEPTENYLDEPDPSILYGHVRATVPAAGAWVADGVVELQIPRAASRIGIGALGLSDLERRAGFDLDEGRYEEIFRGADIVLRKYENQPRIEPQDGHTYYAGGGLYIEPSDGAVLAPLDSEHGISQYGLGSYFAYTGCVLALKQAPKARIEILRANGLETFCVLTSRQQIAAVQFRTSDNDNSDGKLTDFKFHHAIFPRQLRPLQQQALKIENLRIP